MKTNIRTKLAVAALAVAALTITPGCGGSGGSTPAFTALYALTDTGRVLVLSDVSPGSAAFQWSIVDGSNTPLPVQGLDYNSSTGILYAIGQVGAAKTVWRVNTSTGLGTYVTAGTTGATGPVGVSFDPSNGKVAIVEHPSVNYDCGATAGTFSVPGAAFTGLTGISEIAHTGQETGAATTTCYAVDITAGDLYTVGPVGGVRPAFTSGAASNVGSLGIVGVVAPEVGFDIGGPAETAYLAVNLGAGAALFTVDLNTGAATLVGTIGGLSGTEKIVGLCVVE